MKAQDEANMLMRKMGSGELPAEEPVFCLRAQDSLAGDIVRIWITLARRQGTPEAKLKQASDLADAMDKWPTKQVPGRPETRIKIDQLTPPQEIDRCPPP